ADAGVLSRRSHTIRLLRSYGEALAAFAPDLAGSGRTIFSGDGRVCPDPIRCTENECAVFSAAVERPVKGVAKTESGRPTVSKFAAVAEIYRSATSRKQARRG